MRVLEARGLRDQEICWLHANEGRKGAAAALYYLIIFLQHAVQAAEGVKEAVVTVLMSSHSHQHIWEIWRDIRLSQPERSEDKPHLYTSFECHLPIKRLLVLSIGNLILPEALECKAANANAQAAMKY